MAGGSGRRGPAKRKHTKRASSYHTCRRSRQLEVQFSGTLNAEEEGRSVNPIPPRVALDFVPFCVDVHPTLPIAVAGLINGTAAVVSFDCDNSSAEVVTRVSLSKSSSIRSVSFLGPTGAQLLAAAHDTTITIIDANTQSVAWQRRRPPHVGYVTTAAQIHSSSGPDPNLFVTGDEAGAILLWDSRAARGPAASAHEHGDYISALLSPEGIGGGRYLYTAAGDGHIGVFDTRKMKYVDIFKASGRDEVHSLAAISSANALVGGTLNGIIKVWKHDAWDHPMTTIRGHPQEIDALAVLPCDVPAAGRGRGAGSAEGVPAILVSGAMDSTVRAIQVFPAPRALLASVPLLEGAPVDVDVAFAVKSDPFGPTARTASLLSAADPAAGAARTGLFSAPVRGTSNQLGGGGTVAPTATGPLSGLAAAHARAAAQSKEIGVHVRGDDAAGGILGLAMWQRAGFTGVGGPSVLDGGGRCDAMAICITAGDASMHFVDLTYVNPVMPDGPRIGGEDSDDGDDDSDDDSDGGAANAMGDDGDADSGWETGSSSGDEEDEDEDSDGEAVMHSVRRNKKSGGGAAAAASDPLARPGSGAAPPPDVEDEDTVRARAERLSAAFPGVRTPAQPLSDLAPLAPPVFASGVGEALPGRQRVVPEGKEMKYDKRGRVRAQLGFARDTAETMRKSFFSDMS